MLTREHRKERVLVVAHQVIVNCLRYLLERLDAESGDLPRRSRTGRNGRLLADLGKRCRFREGCDVVSALEEAVSSRAAAMGCASECARDRSG